MGMARVAAMSVALSDTRRDSPIMRHKSAFKSRMRFSAVVRVSMLVLLWFLRGESMVNCEW